MTSNRWLIAAAGTVAMACLGTVYSWSLFTQPLIAAFRWSNTTTTWTFALAILFLGIGAVVGGRWQDRKGPRPVAVTGLLLWGLGNVLAGLGTSALGAPWIYVTYGVIGGLGLGLGYVTPVAAVTKWFPDKRGLGSGMVVMGFGLGAFFYNNILKAIPRVRGGVARGWARARHPRRRRDRCDALGRGHRDDHADVRGLGDPSRGARGALRARPAEPARDGARRGAGRDRDRAHRPRLPTLPGAPHASVLGALDDAVPERHRRHPVHLERRADHARAHRDVARDGARGVRLHRAVQRPRPLLLGCRVRPHRPERRVPAHLRYPRP